MFSDEVLEKIFQKEEMKLIPIDHQSTMIRVIEEVLEEMEEGNNATVSES